MDRRNIGVFAHVDAGKTTLTEALLLRSGAIREAGRVDAGTAHSDALPVERRRGISVRAKCVTLRWKDTALRLIDTPGHTDFAAEIERSLWALDGAVLVVSGAEGVQPQTGLLIEALRRQGLPFLCFISKTDMPQADAEEALRGLSRLVPGAAPLWDAARLTEAVCGLDEGLMERYLSGDEPGAAEITDCLRALTRKGEACPVLKGSGLTGEGVEALLDAALTFLPAPPAGDGRLCGVAFAAEDNRVMGRGLWVRLYSGRLGSRDAVTLPGRVDPMTGKPALIQKKITQIRDADGVDTGALEAGDIGVVYGLGGTRVGQVLGEEALLPRRVTPGEMQPPLITVRVTPADESQGEALRKACEALSLDDPLLQTAWSRQTGEISLRAMGAVQLEILEEELRERFGLKAAFGALAILYRETIAQKAVGYAHYTMPKPCWAVIKLILEPLPRGSGVAFVSEAEVRYIAREYQNQVEQALPLALKQGRLGWPVTDLRVRLVGGEHHLVHTHPLDFIVATPWAVHDGLRRAGSVLLEPLLEIHFLLPADCVGRVMSDVALMRGEVIHTRADADRVTLTALVPAASSIDYPTRLAALSGGRAGMAVRLKGYRDCPLELGATAPRRSVDPLDTSRYILAARSALEGGIFDEN
ncbi:MAG: TetM/TetW/TetO/TetS family tetracycline resistance ribosomal protection protein [Clostridia bacterium]|nr:TetM/TetW/TetO/TetS family tetracycline resistance ribosomal protection protein [Clostridia bacterium]